MKKAKKEAAAYKRPKVINARVIGIVISVLAVMGFVIFMGHYTLSAEFFKVDKYGVEGNSHLKDSEIFDLMDVKGKNILSVNTEIVARRLEASPWIKTSYVRKELPSSILVRVTEKSPAAMLNDGRAMYLIDDSGVKLDAIEKPMPGIPVINIEEKHKRAYTEAVRLVNVINKTGELSGKTIEISGMRPEDISLTLNGLLILMGFGDYEKKLASYFSLKDEIAGRNIAIEYIDLRFANRLIVKPVKKEMKWVKGAI
ncbi:cell division protein FtsQ/DivIB [Candidatus Magnetominusculus xianensis]|uniref:Cell division protein FtsQ n=1 Tax=Candidatus Magnetominusculus xianensis TaxID=1748249 RepID=A0ABR5SKX7_9BACT|nr:FtsQ-type POTRA domain-containing protein [Candidatus Magnetominusculus xianensis]KWT89812.1 cell division protein FtsQ [Candidatus Magnetominusculus xianensis]MBF0404599.1 FtsQ-type POTRA domain-containing protein [Nitrospirota bacterium]